MELINPQNPVKKIEIWGFYAYGLGSEPFVGVVMAVCAPVMLQGLSADISVDDVTGQPCKGLDNQSNCSFYIGSLKLNPISFALYVTVVSVVIQAIVFIGLSSLADYGNNRKPFMLISGTICAISCIAYLGVVNENYYGLAAIITIIANVTFGASYVFYYAYLPTLTQNDKQIIDAKLNDVDPDEIAILSERIGNRISSLGFAWGYLGVLVTLGITAGINSAMPDSNYVVQISAAVNGAWYLIFIAVTWKWLASRPGPPLPSGESYLLYSWKSVFKTFREASKLSQVFLVAFQLLHFTTFETFILAFLAPLAAGIGCIVWLQFQRIFKLRTRTMVIIVNTLYLVIPIVGIVSIYSSSVLSKKYELYILGTYHGFLIGALQSYYRTMFSEILPEGKENQFFGLYQITDKGSSWIGPLIVGALTESTRQFRYAFYVLLGSFLIPFFINFLIDIKKGKSQAKEYSQEYVTHDDGDDCNNIELDPFSHKRKLTH
ncbi:MFS general substrate transporter [Conidiobolus coronatus NRRL 28638]|uniref:Autophagy-related protein n=1 Tax=Conidiobolus coronatus (strain ATCC 28846 / CBS 209.66 / NRRL 28638) TaxID=796925 RepID=A0A137P5I2_CONC2|nr:MFS general substrate transporter [Conidiobolus coronatus NRRL 28638]|eukprot:KXN70272.1 MFS general substrate transporter [Conidiobolus coronatus NRRL 28638]